MTLDTASATLWVLRRNHLFARCLATPAANGYDVQVVRNRSLVRSRTFQSGEQALDWARNERARLARVGWAGALVDLPTIAGDVVVLDVAHRSDDFYVVGVAAEPEEGIRELAGVHGRAAAEAKAEQLSTLGGRAFLLNTVTRDWTELKLPTPGTRTMADLVAKAQQSIDRD